MYYELQHIEFVYDQFNCVSAYCHYVKCIVIKVSRVFLTCNFVG